MNIEQEDHILQLLTRFLQDDVEDDERKYVEDWIAQSPSNKQYFEDVKSIWDNSEEVSDFSKINVDEQWLKFKTNTIKINQRKPKSASIYLKVAASIVLLIGLGFCYNLLFNTHVTIVAKAETDNKYILPDKSIVWLNEGSELTYKKDFKDEKRLVHLKGEGFFEVTKDLKKPFVVFNNNTQTKVLGTSFNLKGNTKSKITELVLVTGRVEFLSKNRREILLPGDRVSTTKSGDLVKKVNTDLNFSSWRSGQLKFEKTKMDQVLRDIESYYRKQFVVDDLEFMQCTLTTVFDNESFDNVLETLKVLFDLKYEKNDSNIITIKGGDCNS